VSYVEGIENHAVCFRFHYGHVVGVRRLRQDDASDYGQRGENRRGDDELGTAGRRVWGAELLSSPLLPIGGRWARVSEILAFAPNILLAFARLSAHC